MPRLGGQSIKLRSSLTGIQAQMADILHWPENIGVEFRPLSLPTQPVTELLAVFLPGLADEALVRACVIEPVVNLDIGTIGNQRVTTDILLRRLPAPGLSEADDLSLAVKGVLEGATALFLDGARSAILVRTVDPGPSDRVRAALTQQARFETGMLENVILLRRRLRDPALVARRIALPGRRASAAAIVYMEGRASRDLLKQVEAFLQAHAGEETFRRGFAAGLRGKWGLLPVLTSTQWPDKVAVLLDAGYVAILADGVSQAFVAPVTANAILYSPQDVTLMRPIAKSLRLFRAALAVTAVTAGASIVALMNYHQEMMPTPFLFAMAATREQAPFPIALEVLLLEVIQELIREAAFEWPLRLSPGHVLVAGQLLLLLLAQAGLVGTGPAAISTVIMFSTYGFFGVELIYLLRPWRFLLLVGAVVFGFFGIAAVFFGLALHLMTAESFGVPFFGESGLSFAAADRMSARRKGGELPADPTEIR
ncbi:MAG TPA: spore germination protein [Symbiobacteriaceae bacterium]|nr:spore germination protein [Symbiobacteriaceae bacterium]